MTGKVILGLFLGVLSIIFGGKAQKQREFLGKIGIKAIKKATNKTINFEKTMFTVNIALWYSLSQTRHKIRKLFYAKTLQNWIIVKYHNYSHTFELKLS